jgi:hypothetical protein
VNTTRGGDDRVAHQDAQRNAALAATIALIVAFSAFFATVGADSGWLAALGKAIVDQGAIPHGVPFASAPSTHWHNVPVLAELAFHGLQASLGDRGLMIAQLVAVATAFAAIAKSAAAPAGRTATVLLITAAGTLASLVVVRAQLFSVALFPLLVLLLRREARQPSLLVWLVPALLALWSNLHGAVLIGLGVSLAYLLTERVRVEPLRALLVSLTAPIAVCLTPALLESVAYYRGVLDNVAAQRRIELWAPLSFRSPLDLLTIGAAAVLIVMVLRRGQRLALWEILTIAGLAVLSVDAGRSGVWLIFFLAPLAILGKSRGEQRRPWPVSVAAVTVLLAITCYSVIRGPTELGASHRLVEQAKELADGGPILAPDTTAEAVMLAGGRVWLGNPIDAFSKHDQGVYLDWLDGTPAGKAALAEARVVIVDRASAAGRLTEESRAFRIVGHDSNSTLLEKNG